jgi:hypothetical protein
LNQKENKKNTCNSTPFREVEDEMRWRLRGEGGMVIKESLE